MVPSSSGPGRLVLIQKIEGSTPSGITMLFILINFIQEIPMLGIFWCRAHVKAKSQKNVIIST